MSDAPDATAAPRPMFSGWTITRAVSTRFILTGPDSPELTTLLATLVMAAVSVRALTPRARYSLGGTREQLERMATLVAEEPGAAAAGFNIAEELEPPPSAILTSQETELKTVAFKRQPPRG